MPSKLGFATFWGATTELPRPSGVSSVVFVPNNLETHKPQVEMNHICMAFMQGFKPVFRSTQRGGDIRRRLEDGDWMFWFSPFDQKYKRTHLAYLEHILSDDCKVLRSMERPDSWGLVRGDKYSGFVFVHNNLHFVSRHFLLVNTFIRALWEHEHKVDNWVRLVEAGVDKDEALYFMWMTEDLRDGVYHYSFLTSHHGPVADRINFDNFLSGVPQLPGENRFDGDGWETGIHIMWGNKDTYKSLLGLDAEGRFGASSKKDLVTLIKERKR
jgi:hypothetical protein